MFFPTDESGFNAMGTQLPQHCTQAPLYWQNQCVPGTAQVAQPFQYHLLESHVQPDQNQTFSLHPNYQYLPLTTPPLTNNVQQQHSNSVTPMPTNWSPISDATEDPELEELEEFAETFKQKRISLGLSYDEVASSLEQFYGKSLSSETIHRFENLNMSFPDMCEEKPWLQMWLNDMSISFVVSKPSMSVMSVLHNPTPETIERRRQKRTCFPTEVLAALEQAFTQDPKLSNEKIHYLAQNLGLMKHVVQVWFFNRRHKEKQMHLINGTHVLKRRSFIGPSAHLTLERAFKQSSFLTCEEYDYLAENLGLEKKCVRNWFCRRRRVEKRWNQTTNGITK